jgi:hypothetical protein
MEPAPHGQEKGVSDLGSEALATALTAAAFPESCDPGDAAAYLAHAAGAAPSALLDARAQLGHLLQGEQEIHVRLLYAAAVLVLDDARRRRDRQTGVAEDVALGAELRP